MDYTWIRRGLYVKNCWWLAYKMITLNKQVNCCRCDINQYTNNMAKKQEKSLLPIKQSDATRKSATDFGEASRSAKKIRVALAPFVAGYGDQNIINRLNSVMIKVLKAIPGTMPGERKFIDGYIKYIRGFRFNALREARSLWPFTPVIELKPTSLTFQLSKSYSPSVRGATHTVFQLMVANLDLIGAADEIHKAKNLTLPINEEFKPVKLKVPLNLSGDRALFIAVGVHHLNKGIIISNEHSFACDIIYAERIKDGEVVDFVFADETPMITKPLEDEGIDWETL